MLPKLFGVPSNARKLLKKKHFYGKVVNENYFMCSNGSLKKYFLQIETAWGSWPILLSNLS